MKSTFTKLAALLVMMAMVFSLASCELLDSLFGAEHQHEYSDKWSYDATNHWKVATCDDGDDCKTAVTSKAAHTLSGDKCSVCGWTKPADPQPEDPQPEDPQPEDPKPEDPKPEVHEHTYAETLTAGEATHWYAATCNAEESCADAKKDEAAHDFTNGDCVCGKEAPAALGTEGNPIVIESFPAEITVNYTAELAEEGDLVWYTFTAEKSATLRVVLDTNEKMGVPAGNGGFKFIDGATEYDVDVVEGTKYTIVFSTTDGAAAEFTVTADYVVEDTSKYETVVVAGWNKICFSASEIAADTATRKLNITAAGDYKFVTNDVFVSSVTDANGNAVARNDDYTYTLEAGEYTLTFSMLDMFGVQADQEYSINAEKQAVVEGAIVIGKVNGENVSFTYTTDEEGVLAITIDKVVGGSVEISSYTVNGGSSLGNASAGYVLYVKLKAGDVLELNVETEGGTATINGVWTASTLVPEDAVELEGEGTSEIPLVIGANGVYLIAGVDNFPGKYFTYTATENITVTFTTDIPCLWDNGFGGNSAKYVKSESLLAGESVTFIACMDYGTCDVVLTVTTEEYVPESDDKLKVGEIAEVYVAEDSTTEVTFTITEAGTYIITVLTENGQLNHGMTGMALESPLTVAFTEDELADFDGSYTNTYKVSTTDGAAGYVNIKVEKKTESEETPIEDSLEGTYENAIGDYSIMFFYDFETGVYYMNVWNGSTFDLYYTYTAVVNTDGTIKIDPTFASDYWANSVTEDVDAIADKTFIATPDGDSWTFSIEETAGESAEDSLAGTYENAIGDYSIMFFYDDEAGVYYMNVWNGSTFDLYYTYTAAVNTDGTIKIDPTFASDYWANSVTEDVDAIADKIFIATPDGDSWTFSIEEIVTETIKVTVTDNNCYIDEYSYTATVAGTYTFTLPAGLGFYSKTAYDAWGNAELDYNANTAGGTVVVELAAGETIVFYIGSATKGDYEITVTVPKAEEETNSETIKVTVTDNNCYIDEYSYTATVAGTYTFTLPAGLGFYSKTAYDAWGNAELDYNANTAGGTVVVELAAGETIVFYIGSATKGDYEITVTAPKAAISDDEDVATLKDANGLGGEYTFTFVMDYTLTFTPASAGATSGTLTVVDPINSTYSGTYAYTIVDGAYVFESPNVIITHDNASWTFQNPGMRMAQAFAEYTAPSTDEPEVLKDANGLGGEYTFTFVMDYYLQFTPASAGATSGTLAVVDPINSTYSGTYAYTIVDGEYVFESANVIITHDNASWTFQNPGMRMAQAFAEYTAVSGDSGASETALAIGANQIEGADVTYAYTATEAGTLTLEVGAAIMGSVEISYTVNGLYPESLALNSTAGVVLAAGDKVVITVAAEGYATITAYWDAE